MRCTTMGAGVTGADKSEAKPRGGPRVALLSYFASDEYEWTLVEAARAVIEAAGGSAIVVVGGALSDPHPETRGRAFLLDWIDRRDADAVLSVSSVVGQYVGREAMGAWLKQKGLPVCSIGAADGVPSIGVNDYDGVAQLMRHLIEHHGHRRIAFVRGTASNAEAQQRHRAYMAALEEHEIPYDPELVLPGEFTRESGTRAVCELFDKRQVPVGEIDAVAAANDYMAFGVIDELSRRRIEVPDQVAVVGFDDMPLARIHSPSLTTVRQPLERLGAQAASLLLGILEGKPAPGLTELGTELVLRRSCGCIPTDLPPPLEPDDDETTTVAEGPSDDMLRALAAEMRGNKGEFARALDPLLRRLAAGSARELERNRRVADELATRLRLAREDLIHDLTHRLARALEARMFGPQALLSTALAAHMPNLGVDACVVSEFAEPGRFDELKLAFGFDSKTLQPQMARYARKALVPPGFEHLAARSVIVLPVCYGEQPLGIAVLPALDRDGSFHEVLAEVFGVVLKALEVRRRADSH
ncbi:MAG TPA: substrate-binding domain-containing protein [Polyangiaceae bacterium]|nr:substrate-binding domain-containing protein [Polyangiaceae bacterium]